MSYNSIIRNFCGMCLDGMLLGVQVIAGLGFLHSSHLVHSEDSDPYSIGLTLLRF